MAIPTPPLDASGGYMVVQYSNGTITHRIRQHVLAFNAASATLAYTAPPGGGDAGVTASFTAFAGFLAPFLNNGWTISLYAVFQQSGGVISEVFGYTVPGTVAGGSASAAGPTEAFQAFNFRTNHGGRARFFIFSAAAWSYNSKQSVVANAGGTSSQKLVAYLTGATTGIVGHDSYPLVAPAASTWGTNKKLRRRAGNA